MTETSTYPLRLPRSLKKAVEQQSEQDGTSINQFVATAVAESCPLCRWPSFLPTGKRAPTEPYVFSSFPAQGLLFAVLPAIRT